ncbi:MAG: hypothetical protein ACKOCD_07275, partial [Nitrospiraceae bacterium]
TPASTAQKSWWVEPQANWWFPSLHAKFLSSTATAPGTALNPESDLGMRTTRNFVWPSLTIQPADRHRLTLSYLPMHYGGDTTLTQNLAFAGRTFASGSSLHSDLNFTDASATYAYDVLRGAAGNFFLDVQVHYLDIGTRLRGTAGSGTVDIDKRLQTPIPTIGGGVRSASFHGLSLDGDFNIFKMGIPGFKGELIDSQVGVKLDPLAWAKNSPGQLCNPFAPSMCITPEADRVTVTGGFRYFRVLERDTRGLTQLDWLQKGPYVGLSIRF